MLRIALDTNAYQALDDGHPIIAAEIRRAASIGIPVIVLGELYYGISAGSKPTQNLSNLRRILALPRVQVLHITEDTARLFGEIAGQLRQKGRPIQQNDIWIAALCKQYGYPLATADKDFEAIAGLELIAL